MSNVIICDTRQKLKHHTVKEKYFEQHGLTILRTKLFCGDYANKDNLNVVVDTKQNMQEVVNNICGKSHERFRNECILAQKTGTKLIVLIEEDGIKSIEDVEKWQNPRREIMRLATDPNTGKKYLIPKYPYATTGLALSRAMTTMQIKYGVEFMFCPKASAGKKIMELLGLESKDAETR